MSETNLFIELSAINVNDKTEQKNKLTYLSWPFAWSEVKKRCPDATYNIKRFEHNLPYVFDEKVGYMVFTDVTIDGLTHEMWLPVMDGANAAMKDKAYQYQAMQWQNGKKVSVTKDCAAADMFDINKTIMRCLVKNLAMFGLGLYIYAGEDLPESELPPGVETAVLPKGESKYSKTEPEPKAQVSVECDEVETKRRRTMVTVLLEEYGKPAKHYAEIAKALGSADPRNMTMPEFTDHMKAVRAHLEGK